MQDIYYAIIFYLLFVAFGIIGFAVLSLTTTKHRVLLYLISKPLGLSLVAYPIWLLSSFKLFNFQNDIVLKITFVIFFLAAISVLVWQANIRYQKDNDFFKKNYKFFLKIAVMEFVSILLFAGYLYIKSFNPNIEGTEKFMDLNLLMSAGKTEYFPFGDSWWTGKDVNYYYYGFYLFAFVARLSNIPYSYVYNLALGIIFIQCFVITGVISFRVLKDYITAFFAASLVTFAGNLHYAYCVVTNLNNELNNKCFYPKATRIIDPAYTINEIPSYSFVLGDLHPHVLSIPYFLAAIYLLTEIFKEEKFNWRLFAAFAFVAGTAALINFWDFMTLGFMLAIVVIYKLVISTRILQFFEDKVLFALLFTYNSILFCFTLYAYNFSQAWKFGISIVLLIFFGLFVYVLLKFWTRKKLYSFLYAAWLTFFSSTALILSNWIVYVALCAILTFGFIGFISVRKFFAKELALDFKFIGSNILSTVLVAISPILLFVPFFLTFKSPVTGVGFAPEYAAYNLPKYSDLQYPSSVNFLFGIWGSYLILSFVSLATIVLLKKFRFKEVFMPVLLVGVSIFLIWFTEIFFFQDLFHIANPPYFRANTVFKLTYHAWILIGIGTALFLGFCWRSLIRIKTTFYGTLADLGFVLLVSLVFTSVFIYPFLAVMQAFNPVWPGEKSVKTLTLDGSKYIEKRDQADYETINWINTNLKKRVVILEAAGGAYTYNARISVNTGMRNVINWETHQWTWRFHYPSGFKNWKQVLDYQAAGNSVDTGYSDVSATMADVKTIYETDDIEMTQKLLKKYNVIYVYVGGQERINYSELKDDKFKTLGTPVFTSGISTLYKLND